MKLMAAGLLSLFSFAAWSAAEDSFKIEGLVGSLHVTQDGQDFRVQLDGGPALCGSTFTTAYVNSKDPNYGAFVQALLGAKATKNKITLVSKKDAEGYCKIFYLILH